MKIDNGTIVNDNMRKKDNPATTVVGLSPNQHSIHNNFRISAKTLKKSLVKTIYYLATINNQKIHKLLGFKTIISYAEKTAGFSPKQTRNFLQLAKNLVEYQQVENAIENNDISWGKALEICNRTDPKDQQIWLEKAKSNSLKTLKNNISNSNPKKGNLPKSSSVISVTPVKKTGLLKETQSAKKHFLTLKLTSEQLARWASCMEHLKKAKTNSTEELVLLGLGTLLNGGAPDSSIKQPPYLITIMHCPTCHQASTPTSRGEMPAPLSLIKAGYCDAILENTDGIRKRTIPPRIRRLALQKARYHCHKCQNTQFLEIHHHIPVAQGGSNELSNLIVLCWLCHGKAHKSDTQARMAKVLAPE